MILSRKVLKSLVTALLLTVTQVTKATAFDFDMSRVSVNGFGSLGLITTDNPKLRYKTNSLQNTGVKNSFDAEFGSNFGLQGTVQLFSQISVTAQVVAQRTNDTFEPVAEWLFVKWQPSDALSIRAGRLAAPMYSVSDRRLVNYANVWVRPPIDLYSQIPFSNFNGIDANYRYAMGYGTAAAQVYIGETVTPGGPFFPGGPVYKFPSRNLIGGNLFYEIGPVKLRGGYYQTDLSIKPRANPLVDGVRQVATIPGLESLEHFANDLALKNKGVHFFSFGADVDYKNILLIGEIGRLHFTGRAPESLSWALTAGYRIRDFTPYVTYSQVTFDKFSNPIPTTIPALAPLRAGTNAFIARTGTRTLGAGIRWDVWENIALKFQFDHTKPINKVFNGLFGSFGNVPVGFKDAVNVFSLSVDFVF